MKLKLYSILLGLCFFVSSYAAVDTSTYQADVPIASYSPEDLKKTFSPALEQVLTRINGNPDVTKNAAIRKALSNPSALVQSYNYVPGSTDKNLKLQVRFSPKAIDQLLQSAVEVPGSVTDSNNPAPANQTSNFELHSITMIITEVKTLNDYTSVLKYLRHLEGVKSVENQQTRGNRVVMVVNISHTAEELDKMITAQSQLVKTTVKGTVDPSILVYRWVGSGIATQPAPLTSAPVDTPDVKAASSLPPLSPYNTPKTSSIAPVVEGVPASGNPSTKSSSTDQVQSFGVPEEGSDFSGNENPG